MYCILRILTAALLYGFLLLASSPAMGQSLNCNGIYKDGSAPTEKALTKILEDHYFWSLTIGLKETDRLRANLCGANLRHVNLSGKKLARADLSGARLMKLSKTDLTQANLSRANLTGADLSGAILYKAILKNAELSGANLSGAALTEAIMNDAILFKAQLVNEADLHGAKLVGADLSQALLSKASLIGADLSKATLTRADLSGADLSKANLSEAILDGAILDGAILDGADITGASLKDVNLASVKLDLKPGSLPLIPSLGPANHLSEVTYKTSPNTLEELREALKKSGKRMEVREITFSIKHSERLRAGFIESAFSYILFELTCQYGMSPGRSLWILGALILLFSFPYMLALKTSGSSGIWAVWETDRINKDEGIERPVLVTETFFPMVRGVGMRWRPIVSWLCILGGGLYFSLLSAFHIGWRELNVGNWIVRIQPREYTLKATGWVRTISGIQSLLSVYLLALWVLTYFGRPFE